MTASEVFTRVRRILRDEQVDESETRWSDDELRDALDLGLSALASAAPSTRYVDGQLVDRVELPESDDESFPVDRRYAAALAHFVCHWCYQRDEADTANAQLSEYHLGRFNAGAVS